MSKKCKACQVWSVKKGTHEYDKWLAEHSPICSINHEGSAGSMESSGAVTIFKQSLAKYNLRYKNYVGDGDTSSFMNVVQSKPYGENFTMNKLECIGHVQKRLGSRLRRLVQTYKGKVLSDDKKLNGKGRLTLKAINQLQNYFGLAIRQNTNNLLAMKKAIGAVLVHYSENESEELRHLYCPTNENTWCKWQHDRLTGNNTYKSKLKLPEAIKAVIRPIFIELSDNKLLEKCRINTKH